MKKQLGASFLLAGTAIGSGMLSLPMVLAKFGIINSAAIMLLFAFLTYLTAIIRSDLNLNSHADASLKEVGEIFKCPMTGKLGDFLMKLLHLSLMAAYIFGGSSIIASFSGNVISTPIILILFAICVTATLISASEIIVHVNKFLFIAMFSILITLIVALFLQTPINGVPQQVENISLGEWTTLVPIIFTSFGFQGSIHSMVKFCQNDRKLIKNACIWGSLIPAFVYIVWTAAILLVVFNTDANFFQLMLEGKATDVGQLVSVLAKATSIKSMQAIIWIISLLAILTSILGVGLALLDIFEQEWKIARWQTVSIVVIGPALVSLFVPNAFIRILNVAGVILAIMAIIVPVIISWKMQETKKTNLLLKNKFGLACVFACGVAIVLLGILDLMR